MPSPSVDIGTGTTITYTGFTYEITDISFSSLARGFSDTSHMGTPVAGAGKVGSKTSIAHDLVDPGEVSIEGHFNPDDTPPIEAAESSMVITFPSGATWTANAQMLEISPAIPLEDKMTFSAVFKANGPWTIVAAV